MRRLPAAWRAWALALACAALAHGLALWWVGTRHAPSTPATPVQALAAMAVRMMAAPAPSPATVAAPPADAAALRNAARPRDDVARPAAPPRPATYSTAPGPAATESTATPSTTAPSTATTPVDTAPAEPAAAGTGFRPAGPRADAPSRQLDLNLRSNTYTHTPTLAERSAGQIDPAPAPLRGTGATQVTESRGASGYRARVRTPLGEYCLKRKNPAMQGMSDRPADNTALPTNCD